MSEKKNREEGNSSETCALSSPSMQIRRIQTDEEKMGGKKSVVCYETMTRGKKKRE